MSGGSRWSTTTYHAGCDLCGWTDSFGTRSERDAADRRHTCDLFLRVPADLIGKQVVIQRAGPEHIAVVPVEAS